MAPRAAILRAAIASAMVMATGNPSGMADTASATPSMNIVPILASCTRTATAPMKAAADSTATAITRLKRSIRSTSGGFPAPAAAIEMASRPTVVRVPVATTTPCPRPCAMVVPANAMLRQSAGPASSSPVQQASFRTASDSPVSSASSTSRPCASSRRRSAGTRRPLSSATTSPGTTSALSSSTRSPSRSTVARINSSFCRPWLCCSACHSCHPPSPELISSIRPMNPASPRSPSAIAATAAASST